MDGPLTHLVKNYLNSDTTIELDRGDMLSAIELIATKAALDSILDIKLDKIEQRKTHKTH